MFRTVTRGVAALVLAGGALGALSAPAFAGQGQAYSAPGFPSADASCVGTAFDFIGHYGTEDDTFPVVSHGAVGPTMSGNATSADPGAVGEFESSLAQSHGPVWTCLS